MGPRLGSRGRHGVLGSLDQGGPRFNGATARKPWKTAGTAAVSTSKLGFNGATARKPWKTPVPSGIFSLTPSSSMGPRLGSRGRLSLNKTSSPVMMSLQWGHGSEAVEDAMDPNPRPIVEPSSMGPRLGSRGRPCHGAKRRGQKRFFNGATARKPWKTSNSPRSAEEIAVLQWGHGSEAVEDGVAPKHRGSCCGFNGATARKPWKTSRRRSNATSTASFNGATARKPWKTIDLDFTASALIVLQWGHGSEAVEDFIVQEAFSAMEWLQWGHGSEAVEDGSRPGHHATSDQLQWGHGSEAVEDSGLRNSHTLAITGFNGATARKPWKTRPGAR